MNPEGHLERCTHAVNVYVDQDTVTWGSLRASAERPARVRMARPCCDLMLLDVAQHLATGLRILRRACHHTARIGGTLCGLGPCQHRIFRNELLG